MKNSIYLLTISSSVKNEQGSLYCSGLAALNAEGKPGSANVEPTGPDFSTS